MPQLSLFVDLQNKQLVRGFNNPIEGNFPDCYQGDTLTLFLRFMNPTGNASVPYVDADQSTATVQAAIGTIGGVPTGGTFTLTDPDVPQTTAPIPFSADGPTLQAAIRAGLSTNWSTAAVAGPAGGPWIITNGANGARSALVPVGTALTPAAQGNVDLQHAGDGSSPSVQYLKLQLSPIAYQDTWTAYPAPAVAIANVQTGGVSGSNSIQSVTLNNQPYNGTFTLSFGGQTTAPIAYNASPAAVQAAFQALSSVGSGNASVGGSVGAYQVTFVGTLGGSAQAAITSNAGGLVGPLALVGTFSLATVGIEEAIGESSSISQTFEIKITPAGGNPQTILQTPVSILNDLIPNAPAIPTPTATYPTNAAMTAAIAAAQALNVQKANNGSDFANLATTLSNLWKSLTTTAGALLYMGAASTLSVLAPNASGTLKVLTMTSSVPSWQVPAAGGASPWAVKTANYTLVAGDNIIDGTGGLAFTLPAATGSGAEINIVDGFGYWTGLPSTLTPAGLDYINSVAGSMNLNVNYGHLRLIDASAGNWYING